MTIVAWRAAPRTLLTAAAVLGLVPASPLAQEYVRVPARQTHTDVKADASSGSIALVLIPSGTVLPVIGRQGEWVQVELSPELRKIGIPVRWYMNEDRGFVHESTVELGTGPLPPAKPLLPEPAPSQPPREYVRVPPRQTETDVKAGPNSTTIALLLVPSGTVLPVINRQGEWIEVALSPELRQIGTTLRWYQNEKTGFVHESTVETFTR